MPQSELRLVRRCTEYRPQEHWDKLPRGLRGIYVLYRHRRPASKDKFDVVYVGMACAGRRGGIRGRLRSHSDKKGGLWTHFSAFEVWDNIRDEEIAELEGLFRHLYCRDTKASALNVQRRFKKVVRVRENDLAQWKKPVAVHKPRKGSAQKGSRDGDRARR